MLIYFVFTLNLLHVTSILAARVLLTLYALDLGAEPFAVGILAATYSVLPVLLAVKVGKLADRFGPFWLLICGAATNVVSLLIPYFFAGLPAIFVSGMMNGLSAVLFNLITQNLVGTLSEPSNRARNFSNFSLVNAACNFIGPLYAGFSIDHMGHAYACLSLAVLSAIPLLILSIRGNTLPAATRHTSRKGGGLRSMLGDVSVRRTLVTGSLQNTGDSLYQFYMPVYTHAVGLSASAIGVVLAMYPAAAFATRLVLARLIAKFGEERLLAYAFYAGAGSLMMVPFFTDATMLALISFVFGLGMGCCGPIVTMLMFSNAPEGRSGETMGLKMTVNHLTKVITPTIFGSIASAFGLFPVFWINALMLGGGGFLSHPRKNT